MNRFFELKAERVSATKRQLDELERDLKFARSQCTHAWDDTMGKYTPTVIPGGRHQDLMGHFTVNRDGTVNAPWVDIPPQEIPRWVRTCTICGEHQGTTKSEEVVKRRVVPKW